MDRLISIGEWFCHYRRRLKKISMRRKRFRHRGLAATGGDSFRADDGTLGLSGEERRWKRVPPSFPGVASPSGG
jgi:hypothetical protein